MVFFIFKGITHMAKSIEQLLKQIEQISGYQYTLNIRQSPWNDGWFVENYTSYMGNNINAECGVVNRFEVFDTTLIKALQQYLDKLKQYKLYNQSIDQYNQTIDKSTIIPCQYCHSIPDIVRVTYEQHFDENNNQKYNAEIICQCSHKDTYINSDFCDSKDIAIKTVIDKWNQIHEC